MRPSRDDYFMALARVVGTRTTCLRRAVGCVLVDARGHVLATGYNGVATGQPHCNQEDKFSDVGFPHACAGAWAKSGEQLDACEAIHAEQNALLQCRDVYAIEVCYCTTAPCMTCVKLLLNTTCAKIVFAEDYVQPQARSLWEKNGRLWVQCSGLRDDIKGV